MYLVDHSKKAKMMLEEQINEIIDLAIGGDEDEENPLPLPLSFFRVLRGYAIEKLNEIADSNSNLLVLRRAMNHFNEKVLPH